MKLAIIGAGELGKLIAHHAVTGPGFEIAGYYDDFVQAPAFNGSPVLGNCERIPGDFEKKVFDQLFIGIGYDHRKPRAAYFERFRGKIPFANIIHPSAYVDPGCRLGNGVFLLPGVVLDFGVVIEDNVLINTGGIIAHHSTVQQHSFIAPGVQVAGLVTIGPSCFIGTGATIVDEINIAEGSIVGAGAVVISNTKKNSVSVGVPARIINYREP